MKKLKEIIKKQSIYMTIVIIVCITSGIGYRYSEEHKRYIEMRKEKQQLQQKCNNNFAGMFNASRYYTGDKSNPSYNAEKCNYMFSRIESLEYAVQSTDFAIKDEIEIMLHKLYFAISYVCEQKMDYDEEIGKNIDEIVDTDFVNNLLNAYMAGNKLEDYQETLEDIDEIKIKCENIISITNKK